MSIKLVIERMAILAILLLIVLQLGGAAVQAELDGGMVVQKAGSTGSGFAERCSRMVGFPHNDPEAAELMMQVFR
jgi:hypothetical protein